MQTTASQSQWKAVMTSDAPKITLYYLYVVRCSDSTLYTGITTDVARRIMEHNQSPKGARYTRSRRPVELIYTECFENRSKASRAEHRMKSLSRPKKLELIASNPLK